MSDTVFQEGSPDMQLKKGTTYAALIYSIVTPGSDVPDPTNPKTHASDISVVRKMVSDNGLTLGYVGFRNDPYVDPRFPNVMKNDANATHWVVGTWDKDDRSVPLNATLLGVQPAIPYKGKAMAVAAGALATGIVAGIAGAIGFRK